VVNSLADGPDSDPGDGVCETAVPGQCTLRAAIQQAAGSPGPDSVTIASTGTIALTGELPTITETLAISGPGSSSLAIDGVDSYRPFWIGPGADVEISGLTMANGKAPFIPAKGGAIYNEGFLTLNDVTIIGCSADYAGGAVYNALGSVAIIQNGSRIGAADAPNVARDGGGIFNDGTLAITGTVSYNIAYEGGGIRNSGVAYIAATVSHNIANTPPSHYASGGGILNYQGMMIIRNSSIVSNHTNASGGGVDYVFGRDVVTMTNSTVSGNTANESGGGIRSLGAEVMIAGSTVVSNVADYDQNDSGEGGGIYQTRGNRGAVYLRSSTIAANVDQSGDRDCAFDPVYSNTITSGGYNLVQNPGDCVFTATGDIRHADPLLGPLQDNGGDTLTHALLPNSPAVDQGSCDGILADQRGWPRPIDIPGIPNADDGCDIGAYEYASLIPKRLFYLPSIFKGPL
jgi:CSLREA domain-containing protein